MIWGRSADDGKRWLQPLDVAYPLLLVGKRSRVSGEGGAEEGDWSALALHAGPADLSQGPFLLLFAVSAEN